MSEPFTLELVHRFLKEALKGSQPAPALRSEQIGRLTDELNERQSWANEHSTLLPGLVNAFIRTRKATASLIEDLPMLIREEYVFFDLTDPASQIERAALEELMVAAQHVEALGLPLRPHFEGHGPEVDAWRPSVRYLMTIFKEAASSGSDEAAYRFIAAVTPRLTGEGPTPAAVKVEVIRRRQEK